jgi:hypothetical protein
MSSTQGKTPSARKTVPGTHPISARKTPVNAPRKTPAQGKSTIREDPENLMRMRRNVLTLLGFKCDTPEALAAILQDDDTMKKAIELADKYIEKQREDRKQMEEDIARYKAEVEYYKAVKVAFSKAHMKVAGHIKQGSDGTTMAEHFEGKKFSERLKIAQEASDKTIQRAQRASYAAELLLKAVSEEDE